MFPYSGDLGIVAAANAYTRSDIDLILKVNLLLRKHTFSSVIQLQEPWFINKLLHFQEASLNGLEVIPLVQTFGHLEMLLKHERFSDIKEIYPQVYLSVLLIY